MAGKYCARVASYCAPRSGVASIEQVVLLTTMMVGISAIYYSLGFNETNALTTCSSALEYRLCPDTKQLVKKPTDATSEVVNTTAPSQYSLAATEESNLLSSPFLKKNRGATTLLAMVLMATLITLCWIAGRKPKKKAPTDDESVAAIAKIKKKLEQQISPGCVFTKRQRTMSALLDQLDAGSFGEMTIHHLLSTNVKAIDPQTPMVEVRKLFTEHHFRHVLVCDAKQHLTGIICARDLQRATEGTAADIMTKDPITVQPNQMISPIITMMMDRRIACLPVTEGKKLIGIVTTTDLMIALQCTLQILHSLAQSEQDPLGPAVVHEVAAL